MPPAKIGAPAVRKVEVRILNCIRASSWAPRGLRTRTCRVHRSRIALEYGVYFVLLQCIGADLCQSSPPRLVVRVVVATWEVWVLCAGGADDISHHPRHWEFVVA